MSIKTLDDFFKAIERHNLEFVIDSEGPKGFKGDRQPFFFIRRYEPVDGSVRRECPLTAVYRAEFGEFHSVALALFCGKGLGLSSDDAASIVRAADHHDSLEKHVQAIRRRLLTYCKGVVREVDHY